MMISKWRVLAGVAAVVGLTAFVWGLLIAREMYSVWERSTDGAVPAGAPLLVLGDHLHGEEVGDHFRQRLDRAVSLTRTHSPAYVLISGGGHPSEASAGKRYLIRQGIPADQIITEEHSCSTFENLADSAQIIQSRGADGPVILVTNGYHLRRAVHLADKQGIEVHGVAAESKIAPISDVWTSIVREIIANAVHDIWASPNNC